MTPTRFSIETLELPIVQAPMAGGPSTPALAAAVAGAGGLGFLAAGYKAPGAVRDDVAALRALSDRPFGLNVFAPPGAAPDGDRVAAYATALGPDAGEPRHDDDHFAEKVALAIEERVAIVSFTFGLPPDDLVAALHHAGAAIWVTVTTPGEAAEAAAAGADALVVQGFEAGGHRGSFTDDGRGDVGLLALLQSVTAVTALPLVATGGIMTGRAIAAVLAAGASAAQLGSALMLTPEAATSKPHVQALRGDGATALTRAFSGRTARGIVNRFMREHDAAAPRAYPDVHHVTAPIRAAARAEGDAERINLWAGQAHELARAEPAADLVRRVAEEAREAMVEAARRLA